MCWQTQTGFLQQPAAASVSRPGMCAMDAWPSPKLRLERNIYPSHPGGPPVSCIKCMLGWGSPAATAHCNTMSCTAECCSTNHQELLHCSPGTSTLLAHPQALTIGHCGGQGVKGDSLQRVRDYLGCAAPHGLGRLHQVDALRQCQHLGVGVVFGAQAIADSTKLHICDHHRAQWCVTVHV